MLCFPGACDSPSGPQVFPTPIVFTSDRDGPVNLYVISLNGQTVRRLTSGPESDNMPTWSPDGEQIAFSRHAGGSSDVFIINADGSGLRRLTDDVGLSMAPAWSPDGTRIAYWNASAINIINVDGSGLKRLANAGPLSMSPPAWSPDGSTLAFGRSRWNGGPGGLFVISADGTTISPITTAREDVSYPAWSPDGTRIAFSDCPDPECSVYVVNQDGTGLRRLSTSAAYERRPTWSPDGASIMYESDVGGDGNFDLYVTALSGSAATNVTRHPAFDGYANWKRER